METEDNKDWLSEEQTLKEQRFECSPHKLHGLWLAVMLLLVFGAGAVSSYILMQNNRLADEMGAVHMNDSGRYWRRALEGMRFQSDTTADDIEEQTRFSLAGHRDIYSQIEDWDAYERISNPEEKTLRTACYDVSRGELVESINTAIADLEKGDMYKLILPGNYHLIYTPRGNFPVDEFIAATCAEAGSMFIAHVYDDKILWQSGCGSGAIGDSEAWEMARQCDLSYQAVTKLFE